MNMAALFLFIFSLILTLSPSVRHHSWSVEYRWMHWVGFTFWLVGFSFVHRQTSNLLPERDPFIIPIAALLSGWGLITIYRLNSTFGLRQTTWLLISLLIYCAGIRKPFIPQLLQHYKYLWLISGLILTALTFFFGTYPSGEGPQLWLGCCGIYLQPSEPLKFLLIVYLSAYLADRLPVSFNLFQLLTPTIILVGAALAILLIQRDLGTASLFILLYFIILFLASDKWQILLIGVIIIFFAGLIGYQLFDVIRIRVNAWQNPWLDPSGGSYQIVQSIIAIAAGGVFGSGPGLGSPGIVPVALSDFIFSSIAEETGLIGSFGVLLLLGLFISRGFIISLRSPNNYQRYLAAGLSLFITIQSIFIIGGNLRLLPLTGVTLPFVSYGGSSLLTSFISLLLLSLISNQPDTEPAPLTHARTYLLVSTLIMIGLMLIAAVNIWWSYIRADDLLSRTDNPRNAINERYVLRGSILDRKNTPIAIDIGEPGEYKRELLYPPLSLVIGYSHPIYGQASLEAELNPYLRGLQGNPSSLIWSTELLYGQPPPGLDVRLSLDLELQKLTDELLGDKIGAVVLLNAQNGEILVLASHPYFDPNQMDKKWNDWIQDEHSPLLNRATQGKYPPGTAIGPFLLSVAVEREPLPEIPEELSYSINEDVWNCTLTPFPPPSWETVVSGGCPGALVSLGNYIGPDQLYDLYHILGFDQTLDIILPTADSSSIEPFSSLELASLGQGNVTITPLQMALAASALSTDGNRPSPIIAQAVNTTQQGWVILSAGTFSPSLSARSISTTTRMLSVPNSPTWQSLGTALTQEGPITWYISGTNPDWEGTPLALALVLEENNPLLAQEIGITLLQSTLQLE